MPFSIDTVVGLISSCIPANKTRTHHHVAILHKRGKLLAIASNAVGSRSRGCGYSDRTIHAELAVIKKIGDIKKLNGAELTVVRLNRSDKSVCSSEPCHNCKKTLTKCMREYGLRAVYYS